MAQTAVSKPQNIQKTPVRVTLLGEKKEFVEEIPPEIVPNLEVARTPPVRSPSEVTVPEITETPRKEVKTQPEAAAAQQFETNEFQSQPKREGTMHQNAKPFDMQEVSHNSQLQNYLEVSIQNDVKNYLYIISKKGD